MNRERENSDIIELGTASVETKGGSVINEDSDLTKRAHMGLSDD